MNINSVLGPEDILPGMFVAIATREEPDVTDGWRAEPHQGQEGMILRLMKNAEDKGPDLRGKPFLVVAHDYPFVAGVFAANGQRVTIDLRDHKLVPVSAEFASFVVDERYWRQRYPLLFQSEGVLNPEDLPTDAVKSMLHRGQKVLEHLDALVEQQVPGNLGEEEEDLFLTLMGENEEDSDED